MGRSVTTRCKSWERITILGAFGVISELILLQSSPSFDHGGRLLPFRRFNPSDKPVLDRLFNWSYPSVSLFLHKTAIEFGKLLNASTHYSGKSLLLCLPLSRPPSPIHPSIWQVIFVYGLSLFGFPSL